MTTQRHTRDSIIQTLKNIAAQSGRTVFSRKDVAVHMPLSAINYHFGNLNNALKAAGLAGNKPGSPMPRNRLTDEELFESLLGVEHVIGHAPSMSEYRANGGTLSNKPFSTRFGHWPVVLQHYNKWKAERGSTRAIPNNPSAGHDAMQQKPACTPASALVNVPSGGVGLRLRKLQLFGEPIDFRGLRHAPINEQGVVYLFGMVSRELGFSVEALQQGFPDCEGKYLHDKSRQLWAKARIEFEFRGSNFREHCHDEHECDVIVCWENDWPDCPLRVVELRAKSYGCHHDNK